MANSPTNDGDPIETKEWLDALGSVIRTEGVERAQFILEQLGKKAYPHQLSVFQRVTPYCNTIPVSQEPVMPGDPAIEHRLRSLIRWNAMAMVVRAQMVNSSASAGILVLLLLLRLYTM